jgi:hypothetical protein
VPAYTAACAIGLVAYLGFACLAAQESDGRTICLALIWSLAAYQVATWVAAAAIPDFAYIPPYGDKLVYRLQGISGHPNILAKQAAVFLLLVIAARRCGYLGAAPAGASSPPASPHCSPPTAGPPCSRSC